MRPTALLLTALLIVAAGCSQDTDPAATGVSGRPTAVAEGSPRPEPEPTGSPTAQEDVTTLQAGQAGEVDIRTLEPDELELVTVREAPGWRHTVDKIDRDEVELDFHHDSGRTFRFEVEIEDGRLKSS